MKFDKNKDDIKNLDILKKEILKIKSPFSRILVDSLFNPSSSESDEFRNTIKENISQYIKDKIK